MKSQELGDPLTFPVDLIIPPEYVEAEGWREETVASILEVMDCSDGVKPLSLPSDAHKEGKLEH